MMTVFAGMLHNINCLYSNIRKDLINMMHDTNETHASLKLVLIEKLFVFLAFLVYFVFSY